MKSISSVAEMAAARQHQTGRLAGITIAAMLSVAATAGVAGAKVLDGAAASQMIVDQLAREGLAGTPAIKAGREFPACDGAVSVEPMFGSWNTVSLACDGASKWRFAIRTNLTTRPQPVPMREFQAGAPLKGPIERAVASRSSGSDITDLVDVVALKHSVRKNAMISADDLILVPVPARNTMGVFFDPADLVGRRMKSSLTAQKPVLARHLHPDWMVEEGNEVLIVSATGGISVDMLGFSLENGQIGDWVSVENASSGKIVRAKIIGEKKVAVLAKKS